MRKLLSAIRWCDSRIKVAALAIICIIIIIVKIITTVGNVALDTNTVYTNTTVTIGDGKIIVEHSEHH